MLYLFPRNRLETLPGHSCRQLLGLRVALAQVCAIETVLLFQSSLDQLLHLQDRFGNEISDLLLYVLSDGSMEGVDGLRGEDFASKKGVRLR